jgi:AcrR family transcriptional regulator
VSRTARNSPGRKPPRSRVAAAPGLPQTEKGRRTRERLLRGAAAAIGKHGYDAVRIDQIAAEADVPVGLFYRYFRSKRDVTLEVLQSLTGEFRASVPGPESATLWERELAIHRNFSVLFGQGKTGLLTCYFSDSQSADDFGGFFASQTRQFLEEHASAIRGAVPGLTMPEPELRTVILALMSMTEAFLHRFFTGRETLDASAPLPAVDFVWLLAALRYRGLVAADPPRPHVVDLSWLRLKKRRVRVAPSNRQKLRTLRSPEAKRADSQQSLELVLDTTRRLLNVLGYDDLRIVDIESESGVTRGVIYHHFSDKRELVLCVLLERLRRISARLTETPRDAEASLAPLEALLGVATVLAEELAPDPGLLRAVRFLEDRDREFARSYQAERAVWQSAIADVLATYLGPSEHHLEVVRIMASAFVAMAERFVYDVYVMQLADTRGLEAPAAVARLIATLWYRMGFGSHPESGGYGALGELAVNA